MIYFKNSILFYLFFDYIFSVQSFPDSTGFLLAHSGGGEVGKRAKNSFVLKNVMFAFLYY